MEMPGEKVAEIFVKELMEARMTIKMTDEIKFCCKKMRSYFRGNDIRFDFDGYKLFYKDEPIDVCPFCGADIEVDVSTSRCGGE